MGDLILFADDTTLLNKQKNHNLLEFSMVHDMEILIDWFHANKLSLNMSKMVLLHFWPRGQTLTVAIGDIKIPWVTSTKFLGVILRNNMYHMHWKTAI